MQFRTVDRIGGSDFRRRITIQGDIKTVLFPGVRGFVFAILDAGFTPETVLSVVSKAISDWQDAQPQPQNPMRKQ